MALSASGPAPVLSKHDIHVWHATLAATPENLAGAAQMLPEAEREKTALVASEAQRARLTLSRAWVRGILARYLSQPAPEIAIRRTPKGKPQVATESDKDAPLQFSVSHAGDHMLVAVTRSDDVGVDLERMTRLADAERIAARFFARPEHDALLALPADQRADAFFRAWVRKEAVVKALGTGIATAFDAFTVSLGKGGQQEVDVTGITGADRQRLWVQLLDIGRVDYLAAVAYAHPDSKVTYGEWQ
ncbi:MAG: 4'-phosphopantetheinyl transferase superfamily protein [Gemmatimonadota bacterium]|nr:4'-phosphopantetheinyl transferase superfamily protein [Gemmatimonadota bacterium]HEU4990512.1 4'-phosphopantetheinyl transferase superfamily protein [Gemmatimonadaceae bacterium]